MKKRLLILSVLLLTACGYMADTEQDMRMGMFYVEAVPVENFGSVWNQAVVDPEILGGWQVLSTEDHPIGPDEWRVSPKAESYGLQSFIKAFDIYDTSSLKEISAGRYKILLIRRDGESGGYLCRYAIMDGVWTLYRLRHEPTLSWLGKRYPLATNIGVGDYGEYDPSEPKMTFVRIKYLDGEVLKILADIPDDNVFWEISGKYKKESGDDPRR